MNQIQVGLRKQRPDWHRKMTFRPFYVAAVETLSMAEFLRFDYETTEKDKKKKVIENALGLDSASNALLVKDTTYQVKVTYNVDSQHKPAGRDASAVETLAAQEQSFWFRTDDKSPERLDSWILCTVPGDGEKHYFASQPLNVVFGTNNVALIFDAYGEKIQARLKASSFRPINPPGGVQHPLPINPTTLNGIKKSVLSPWEDTVQGVLTDSCVPISGETVRHEQLTIPIPLDLYTDYVLDIEKLPKSAADGSPGTRIWRLSFSTGAFRTLEEFAQSFRIARLGHRSAQPGALQAMGNNLTSNPPKGADFDNAWITAGMDPMEVPQHPRVTVFWDTAPTPQPVAVLVDSSEPMKRSRPVARELPAEGGPPGASRWEMKPVDWLTLAEQPGGDAIIDKIVLAPGAQRALVTLKPNARGKKLRLALKRLAQPEPYLAVTEALFTIAEVTLQNAPWEEVD